MIKIILADDDALIRESLNIIFSMDDRFEIVDLCLNGEEAVESCLKKQVDVAVMDVRMPILNGVDATKKITEQGNTRVMILTTFDEDEYIAQGFKNGASGYLLKNTKPKAIIDAVIAVANGLTVMDDIIVKQMRTTSQKSEFDVLTQREMEVVELIAEGYTNQEIASELFISEGTVKNTVSNILSKLELKHRTQIAIFYLT